MAQGFADDWDLMGYEFIPPPVWLPPLYCTEQEAIAQGAPTDREVEEWIVAANEQTLWEYVIAVRRQQRPVGDRSWTI